MCRSVGVADPQPNIVTLKLLMCKILRINSAHESLHVVAHRAPRERRPSACRHHFFVGDGVCGTLPYYREICRMPRGESAVAFNTEHIRHTARHLAHYAVKRQKHPHNLHGKLYLWRPRRRRKRSAGLLFEQVRGMVGGYGVDTAVR